MSTHRNPNQRSNQFGNEHSRPLVSSPTMLSCRICNQIFLSTHSLSQHYESHEYELIQRAQNQTNPYLSSLRENRDRNLTNNQLQPRLSNSSTLQQRYHPYFPAGIRMLQRQRTTNHQTNPFLASAQNQNVLQPRHPVANNNLLRASSQFSNGIAGRNVSGANPLVIHRRLSPTQQLSVPQQVLAPKLQVQKGQIESEETGAVWYLGQLEKPIPKVIDLERENESHDNSELDLTLKL